MCGSLSSLWWLEQPEMQPLSVGHSAVSDSLQSWTVAHRAPLSMGFSRQEYWSGLPFPSPGIFTTQGPNPVLLHCRQTLYCLNHKGSNCLSCQGSRTSLSARAANMLVWADGNTKFNKTSHLILCQRNVGTSILFDYKSSLSQCIEESFI